jgi:hypothetical protein
MQMSDAAKVVEPQESAALVDAFFETYHEALREAQRRKAASVDSMITRIEESPYGGYRVWSMPADVYVDLLSDNLPTRSVKLGKVPA